MKPRRSSALKKDSATVRQQANGAAGAAPPAPPTPQAPAFDAESYLARLREEHTRQLPRQDVLAWRRLRPLGRRARRIHVLLGLDYERLVRAWRSPRHRLGRIRARLEMFSKTQLVRDPRIASFIALIATAAAWKALRVDHHVATLVKDAAHSIFTGALVGVLVLAWSDYVRSPQQARRLRRRIRKHPELILPFTPGATQAEVIPHEDLFETIPRDDLNDEVILGLLPRDRRDVQVIVGDPGSGKTTALVGLAGRLARIGMVPVFVPLRANESADVALDIVKLARERFERQARAHMRSETELGTLWQWLYCRKRIAVLTDDVDQIGPDGEKGFVLRRTLEALATKDVPVVVTARPAGIPAGVAASAIALGELDEDEVVERLTCAARRDPGAIAGSHAAPDELRRWVRGGKLTQVPFYLELLAALDAVGACPKFEAPEGMEAWTESVRFRRKPGGEAEANPNWVRLLLLEHYYDAVADGRAHRWLGIGSRERRSTLRALEGAALGVLTAVSLAASLKAAGVDDDQIARELPRRRIEDFLGSNDRNDLDAADIRKDVSAHEVVDAGERLRLLERTPDGALQFQHRIMEAYLAARALREKANRMRPPKGASNGYRDDFGWWVDQLLDDHHPEKLTAHMALLFAALRRDREREAAHDAECKRAPDVEGKIVHELVAKARARLRTTVAASSSGVAQPRERTYHGERRDPDDGLLKLTTAADIASSTRRFHSPERRGADQAAIVACVERADCATRWTKLDAIRAVAALGVESRWDRIWQYTRDNDYEVRRAASAALQDSAELAYGALRNDIRQLLEKAARRVHAGGSLETGQTPAPASNGRVEAGPPSGWTMGDALSLKALGWVLPALVSGLREDSLNGQEGYVQDARRDLENLVALAISGDHHGLGASVAQGFKGDAMRHAADPTGRCTGPGWVASNRRLVDEICQRRPTFWYTRMVTYQALALYAIAASQPKPSLDSYVWILRSEDHPFARPAARLARRALERHQVGSRRWDGMIWNDEGEVVARRPTVLTYKAARLVGDVTLLLNLNEGSGEDGKAEFGHKTDLPYCLSASPDRREVLGAGCPSRCGWKICPYEQPPPDEPNAHRGISRAFCRYETQAVRRRRTPAWQPTLKRHALERFWRELERRARS